MPLNYDPSTKEDNGVRAEPGLYGFKVDEVCETTFRTGSRGLKVTLLVSALADRDVKIFENFVYLPKALWRLDEFLKSIGLDFNEPPDPWDIEGKTGKAEFSLNEKKYLQVESFIPASANNAPRSAGPTPAQPPPDSIPF